jgi:hypothetical protein
MCRRDLDESVARAVEAEEEGFEDMMGSAALSIYTRSWDAKSRHPAMQETETIRYWIGFIRTRTHSSLLILSLKSYDALIPVEPRRSGCPEC